MDLKMILADHQLWLNGEGGVRANLSGTDLRDANLTEANLREAYLWPLTTRSKVQLFPVPPVMKGNKMKEVFVVDKDIPIPKKKGRGKGGLIKYPFEDMEVGDSFFVPRKAHQISASTTYWKKDQEPYMHYAALLKTVSRVSEFGEQNDRVYY